MHDKSVYICIPTTSERKERLATCIESIHKNAGYPHVICTYENYREGFIQPILRILAGLKPDQLVWCIGDDTLLVERDTLKRLVDAYKPDHVINPDDGIQHGAIITMPLSSAITMRFGTYAGYFLNYADLEFTAVMTCLGRYIYLPEVKVQHSHWRNQKAIRDDTYAFADEIAKIDLELFNKRKETNFKDNLLLL